MQWLCPYNGSSFTDNINDKWKLQELLEAQNGSKKYVDPQPPESIGAVIYIKRDLHVSAQSIKDIVDLQGSLCPEGSPQLLALPPLQPKDQVLLQTKGGKWIFGLCWGT